ncbi:hypothetical protein BKA62DRAFT_675746 [Auriculariales sp. MPI-PUGE-AT-0066]|nr:hypothetical protein BKA62DRAFT_675746 [Auriculariales sp. MPI-PUGE-AT-0066]
MSRHRGSNRALPGPRDIFPEMFPGHAVRIGRSTTTTSPIHGTQKQQQQQQQQQNTFDPTFNRFGRLRTPAASEARIRTPPPPPQSASPKPSVRPKNYNCDECDAKFARPSEVIIHMRSHTGERPFGCTVCGLKLVTASNVARHMRTVHAHAVGESG